MKKLISLIISMAMICVMLPAGAVSGAFYTIGDLNSDGLFNGKDSNLMIRYLNGTDTPTDIRPYDICADGVINGKDGNLLILAMNGGYDIPQPAETTPISSYTIVYPENATEYEQYAAELLADYVSDNYGVTLTAVPDTAAETEYEILIGNTSRAESATETALNTGEYQLWKSGEKLVLGGKDYMIGGAVGDLTYNFTENGEFLTDSIDTVDTAKQYSPIDPDSVILMIGDGMGFNHVAFTNAYMKTATMSKYSYTHFMAEDLPNCGSVTTYALSALNISTNQFTKVITDSASAATALATGWKTQRTFLGVDAFKNPVTNVRELCQSLGYKSAVMTTEPITGATPSGFTVHNESRYNTAEILASDQALVDSGEIDYLKGDVYDNILAETKIALDQISTGSDGFFAMIEEAYIDKACDMTYAVGETVYTRKDIAYFVYRFDTAIRYAMTFAASRPDTALIVTADHETGGLSTTGTVTVGNHTNADVPVYAMGKGTEIFSGTTVDNTDIAKFIASVYGETSFGGTYSNIAE